MLYGRGSAMTAIDRLLSEAVAGVSGTLVLSGEAGIGKSALLRHTAGTPGYRRVLRAVGIESETRLPYAGLNLMLSKEHERIDALPAGQAQALHAALGLGGAPGERHLVGLAVLNLLSDLAEDGPLLCLVDDAHWFDEDSAEALLFAARRLEAEGVVMMFAVRDPLPPAFAVPGLPELHLERLDRQDAADLLSGQASDLPGHARSSILDQSQGNPLALTELLAAYREGRLPAFPYVDSYRTPALASPNRVQQGFADRVGALPAGTRDLLLLVAADVTGDPATLFAAGERLGCSVTDLEPAEHARLVRFDTGRLDFRHPLIRAAVYQGATLGRRLAIHRVLAEVFGESGNVCQRAWHLAAATAGPDEEVAGALEKSAEIDRMFGGHAAVAAAYERAAELSCDGETRGRRLAAAASAAAEAGQPERAAALADSAAPHVVDPLVRNRLAMIRATLADEGNRPSEAHRILSEAAGSIAAHTPDTADLMLTWAVESAWTGGDSAGMHSLVERAAELGLRDTKRISALARTAGGLDRLDSAGVADGMTALWELVSDPAPEPVAGRQDAPIRSAGATVTRWHLLLGDHARAHELALALEQECRTRGALGMLPQALALLTDAQFWLGSHHDARASATEGLRIARDIGQVRNIGGLAASMAHLAAVEGDEERCRTYATDAVRHGQLAGAVRAECALALLDLCLGQHERALARLEEITAGPHRMPVIPHLPDLVEAAVRLGRPDRADGPCSLFDEWAERTGQHWARAVALRSRALLAADDGAESLFAEAVELHRHGVPRPFERARTELLFGEWLRRARRLPEARPHLRTALELFGRLGTVPLAERANTELRAAGERGTGAARQASPLSALTPQELKVVRLAAGGLSNRDIGTQLFLSPRTVSYHLYKAYPKLGVTSRAELVTLAATA